MSQGLNWYRADLRDLRFVLFEHLGLGALLERPTYAEWGPDEVAMVLDETYRFARDVLGPLNGSGDREGCRLEDGQVRTPAGFREAWKKLYEAGWKSLGAPEAYGGQGAPAVLQMMSEELLSGANTAFNMYPALTIGAADLIETFGDEGQKERFARRMFTGEWAGTMCLTEPAAGSDVGAAVTSAKKRPDGCYDIKGTKIYISGGDHDLTDNIVHLVLARVDGAPPGTKGLSLFAVPKRRIADDGSLGEGNDVAVASIEHKMGINGSSTAVLQFGENDGCVGELLGPEEHRGIRQMFQMMNYARIGVGVQGLGLASAAYLNALEYAKDRVQGPSVQDFKDPTAPKVPIIQHPNVRRSLLDMKARVEGIRALIAKVALHGDWAKELAGQDDDRAAYHQGQVDLLTPIVKAYASDQAFRIAEAAIQVYGGAGYLEDYPVEQYARDSKIFSIYEGTNAIQAMDLVGRKLGQRGGANTQALLGDLGAFVAAQKGHEAIGEEVRLLGGAQEAVSGVAMQFLGWFQAGEVARVPLHAEAFLELMSELVVGWLLLEQAEIASRKRSEADAADRAFYDGKLHAARYFARNVLADLPARAKSLVAGDASPLEIPDEAFAKI